MNSIDAVGSTPLRTACIANKLEIVQLLLEKDEIEYSLNLNPKNGCTPLHGACMHGCIDVVKCLLAKQDIITKSLECKSKYGETPLHVAVVNNHPEIVQFLLGAGASFSCLLNFGGVWAENALP